MTNPTLPSNEKKYDRDDIYFEGEGLIVNDKVVVSTQQANVADATAALAITWSSNDPGGTPNGAITIANGSTISNAEIAELMEEVEAGFSNLTTKVNAILAILEAHGLMADS